MHTEYWANLDSEPLNRAAEPKTGWLTPLRFAALLALLLVTAFPKVALGLHSFVYRDYGVLGYPFIHYARESFWRGELPLWNPFSNCGAPFLAQWGTMTLYPFSIFYLLLPLPWSLSFFCLGHLFLGGLGMYLLARRWTGHSFAASVAGVAFVFNGVTLSCLMWPNYTAALGWMPWVIGAVERAGREGGRRIVLAALVGALQMLAGVPEIAGFTWLLALAVWAGSCIREKPAWRQTTSRLAGVALLVAGLTAVQMLPFFDLLEHSQRDRTFATTKWALPGWGWANLLVPLFHCFQCYQGPFVQQGQAFFSSCYLGAGLLALGVTGAWRGGHWRGWILGLSALFGLIAALGENGHLYVWMKRLVPLLGVGRYPVKFMLLPAFALPLLAGFAISWWMGQETERSRAAALPPTRLLNGGESPRLWFLSLGTILLAGTAAILWFGHRYPFELDQWPATWHNAVWRVVFLAAILGGISVLPGLTRRASIAAVAAGILVLLALDSTTHTPDFNPTIAAAEFEPGLWERYRQTPSPKFGESRVMISPKAERVLLSSTETNLARDFFAKRLALWSNLNLLDDVPKVNGSSTLQLREQKQVETLLYGDPNRTLTGLVDFLAVSHSTAPAYALDWSSRSNYCAMVTCGQQPVFATPETTTNALANPNFDPRKVVYLPVESKPLVVVSNQTEAKILRSQFSAHRVEIEVDAKAPSLVVIAQTFYHPWRASIDGRSVPLLRANHAFQAVQAPEGHSRIILHYQDRRLSLGAAISGLAALVCLGSWLRQPPITKRGPPQCK